MTPTPRSTHEARATSHAPPEDRSASAAGFAARRRGDEKGAWDARREFRCMERVSAGDERALRELFDHTGGAVLRILRSLLPGATSADDVLTEVYTEAWRRRRQFDPARSSPLGWLVVIARTRAIDRLRRIGRDRNVVVDDSEWFDRQSSELDSGPRIAERNELVERVRSALLQVPLEQRRALWASFFAGASHSEIADASGIPLGTVKSRIRSALAQLRTILVDYADGPFVAPDDEGTTDGPHDEPFER